MASSGDRPRRVLIIVENLPVPFDRRVWSEATALQRAGYEVSVICPRTEAAPKSNEVLDGVHIWRHPLGFEAEGALGFLLEYGVALFWETVLAWRILFARGFDVIHLCNPPDLLFLVALPFKLLGKKVIFDHHDLNPELYEAKFGKRGFFWKLLTAAERMTFAAADISIATNESYRRIAIERGGMPEDRVFVVRSGPNLNRVKEVPADPSWKKGRPYLVAYVGVMGAQEGIDLLLETVRHLIDGGRTDIQFVLVGSGPSFEGLRAQAKALGVEDYVTFTGRVDDATLLSALSTAEVCVNPDRPNEMNDKSTMNKIMEYMALGKPIVQFDLTEGRFSAQDASLYARNGDIADFAEKITGLLDDPQKRAAMGAFGRARVRSELSWPHEEPKLLAAYDAALAERAVPVRSPT